MSRVTNLHLTAELSEVRIVVPPLERMAWLALGDAVIMQQYGGGAAADLGFLIQFGERIALGARRVAHARRTAMRTRLLDEALSRLAVA